MAIRIVDVTDDATFALLPPCADPGFDHRSCDYWEDADRGSKAARASWFEVAGRRELPSAVPRPRNPFGDDEDDEPAFNPFAPGPRGTTFNPFLAADDDAPARTRSRPRRRPARPSAPDAPPQAAAAGPRAGGVRLVRQGAARGRRARGLRPVRAAVRVPARAPDPRALPAAARLAAARGDHLHRHDRRSARPRASPRCWSRRSATTSPGAGSRPSRRTRRSGARPNATSAADAGVLGAARVRRRGGRRALPGHAPGARVRRVAPAAVAARWSRRWPPSLAPCRRGVRRALGPSTAHPADHRSDGRRRAPATPPSTDGSSGPPPATAGDASSSRTRRCCDPPPRRSTARPVGHGARPFAERPPTRRFARNVEAAAFGVVVDDGRPRLGRRRAAPRRPLHGRVLPRLARHLRRGRVRAGRRRRRQRRDDARRPDRLHRDLRRRPARLPRLGRGAGRHRLAVLAGRGRFGEQLMAACGPSEPERNPPARTLVRRRLRRHERPRPPARALRPAPRPRPARHRRSPPGLAAGGRPADAHEQPRPGGGRGPGQPRRLRRNRPGRAQLGGVRRHRPRAAPPRRRRDAPRPVGQAGRGVPDPRVGAARPDRQLQPRRQVGHLGATSASSSGRA